MTDQVRLSDGKGGPPPLTTTASVVVFGSLAWIGIVWAVAAVVFAGVLVAVGIWGELDGSLWHGLGAGMQRWLFAIAGYTMVSEFGRMFITNGVTRGQLARSALLAMVVLSVLGSAFATLVYVAEGVVFDVHDWPHRIDGEPIDGGDLGRIFGENALTLAAFFTTGWLLATCFRSHDRELAGLFVVPSLVPAAAAQLLLRGDAALFGFLDRLDVDPSLAVGAAVTLLLVLLGAAAAERLTRQYAL